MPARSLVAALLAALPRGGGAWSSLGHARIAQVAQEILSQRNGARVRAMLQGNIVALSRWEAEMTEKHPETGLLHWHRQDPEWTCGVGSAAAAGGPGHLGDAAGHIRCDDHGAEKGSLFCALAYFFDHFAHDALLREFPQPKEPISAPKTLPALAQFQPSELTPSHYLRWLVMLVGDLHQPLHWLRDHNYGQDLKVLFRDREYTLLSFWEEFIAAHLPDMPSQQRIVREFGDRQPAWWDTTPPELFRQWAREAGETVCDQVYAAMQVKLPDGSWGLNPGAPFALSEEVYHRWLHLAHDFTMLGGERLAYVLNDVIVHRQHKAAHREGRGRHHYQRNWQAGLGANAAIGAVVVPLTLVGLRLHECAGGECLFWGRGRKHLKT